MKTRSRYPNKNKVFPQSRAWGGVKQFFAELAGSGLCTVERRECGVVRNHIISSSFSPAAAIPSELANNFRSRRYLPALSLSLRFSERPSALSKSLMLRYASISPVQRRHCLHRASSAGGARGATKSQRRWTETELLAIERASIERQRSRSGGS